MLVAKGAVRPLVLRKHPTSTEVICVVPEAVASHAAEGEETRQPAAISARAETVPKWRGFAHLLSMFGCPPPALPKAAITALVLQSQFSRSKRGKYL